MNYDPESAPEEILSPRNRDEILKEHSEYLRENPELREHISDLKNRAYNDGGTGLIEKGPLYENIEREFYGNFREFVERKNESSLEEAYEVLDGMTSFTFLDLDNFKDVNDKGQSLGDEVLRKVAETIEQVYQREADLVSRVGGDEFLIYAPNTPAEDSEVLNKELNELFGEIKTSELSKSLKMKNIEEDVPIGGSFGRFTCRNDYLLDMILSYSKLENRGEIDDKPGKELFEDIGPLEYIITITERKAKSSKEGRKSISRERMKADIRGMAVKGFSDIPGMVDVVKEGREYRKSL